MIADTITCGLVVLVFVMLVVRGRRFGRENVPQAYDCESVLIGLAWVCFWIAFFFSLMMALIWFRVESPFLFILVLPILMGERIIRSILPIALVVTVVWGIVAGRNNPGLRPILMRGAVVCAGLMIDWVLWWSMEAITKTISLSQGAGVPG